MGRPKNFSREEVLKKAIPLFWKQGFADTSLQDLEKATSVNKSGLYAEFNSKENLFLATLRYYIENLGAKDVLNVEPLGWDNIERFLGLVQTCTGGQKGCFAINSIREFATLPGEAAEIIAKSSAQVKRLLVKNIRNERTKIDPEIIAEMVSTIFCGLCLEQNISTKKSNSLRKFQSIMKVLRSL